jgi:CubicO group peptidase (beta-lactamase class C family)
MKQRAFFVLLSFSAILAFLLIAGALVGQARLVVKPEAVSRVDEMLTQRTRDGKFTGSVLIAQDGVVLFSKGYGLADRVQGIPNTPQTRFHLGSLSKQFTAMAILILESQGKLSVQDPICNFIADCPQEWQEITIHHLLTHTSGLSSIQSGWRYDVIDSATSGPVTPARQAETLGFTLHWFLDAQPGEQYAYSNFGYCLLAYIIEQVSGQSYADFLNQAIFTPLGMHNTGYHGNSSGAASVYSDSATTTAYSFGDKVISEGGGNLYSSTEDLYLWDQALYTDRLLPRAKLDQMLTPFVRQSDVPGFGYGYGWLVTRILGRPVVGGAGGGPYNTGMVPYTIYVRLPADRLTLIVLVNQAWLNGFPLLGAIASELFLRDLIFVLAAIAFLLVVAVLLAARLYRNKIRVRQ